MSDEIQIPIVRVDEERREVWGEATSEVLGHDGLVLEYDGSVEALEGWLGNVREMHQPKAVGRALAIQPMPDTRKVAVGVRISRGAEDTWQKVLDGTLRFFSVKGPILESATETRDIGGVSRTVRVAKRWRCSELSLVDAPGDRGIKAVEVVRAAGIEDEGEIEGDELSAPDDLERAAGHEVMRGTHSHEHAAMGDQGGDAMHSHEHSHEGDANHDHAHEAERTEEPGGEHVERATAEIVVEPDADLAVERAAWEARGVDVVFRRDYSSEQRAALAEKGEAIPVKNAAGDVVDGRFPIADKTDLEAAVRSYGRAGDKAEAKAWIEKRAKALGATDMLPDDWAERLERADGESAADEMTDAQLAEQAIAIVKQLIAREAQEQAEGDDDESYDIAVLTEAMRLLQCFANGEAMEAAGMLRSKEAAMASVEDLTTKLGEITEQFTDVVARLASVEQTQEQAVQRAAEPNPLADEVQRLRAELDELKEQPAPGGPLVRVPDELMRGDLTAAEIERVFGRVIDDAPADQRDDLRTLRTEALIRDAHRRGDAAQA